MNEQNIPALLELIEGAPEYKSILARRQQEVEALFAPFIKVFTPFHYALAPFVSQRPFCYINYERVETLYNFLKKEMSLFFNELETCREILSGAIQFMFQPSPSWQREEPFQLQSEKDYIDMEALWHPEYVRYYEQVFDHLIRPLVFVLCQPSKNKNINRYMDLDSCVNILTAHHMSKVTAGYNDFIRNSIADGTYYYAPEEIKYVLKRLTRTLPAGQFGEMMDDLVNSCNSILTAYLLVIAGNYDKSIKILPKLPLGILRLILNGLAGTPDISIPHMVECFLPHSKIHLTIHVKAEDSSPEQRLGIALSITSRLLTLNLSNYSSFGFYFEGGGEFIVDSAAFAEAVEKKLPLESLQEIVKGEAVQSILAAGFSGTYPGFTGKKIYQLRPFFQLGVKSIENISTLDLCQLRITLYILDRKIKPSAKKKLLTMIVEYIDELKSMSFPVPQTEQVKKEPVKKEKWSIFKYLPFLSKYVPQPPLPEPVSPPQTQAQPLLIEGSLYFCNKRNRNIDSKENRILRFRWQSETCTLPRKRFPLDDNEKSQSVGALKVAWNTEFGQKPPALFQPGAPGAPV